MKHTGSSRGFTVLEFLVVIGIIGILVGLVLVSLGASRARSRDERRIARIQNISVGIEEFAKECRHYPIALTATTYCENNISITVGQFLPDIDETLFNQTGSEFLYQPLSYPGGEYVTCTGYHLGVQLENQDDAFANRDSQHDSSAQGASLCMSSGSQSSTTSGFDGTANGVYDLKR